MTLGKYNDKYRAADTSKEFVDPNQFPDGHYRLKILECKHIYKKQEGEKPATDYIVFDMEVDEGDYEGFAASTMFVFNEKRDSSLFLKYLVEACGLEMLPLDFEDPDKRAIFSGYIIEADKVTKKGKFINWQRWKLVSAPESTMSDGSEYDTDDDGVLDLDNEPDPFEDK
jgi:hypothetical protein